jgi:Mn2+/Fe2+ NRAMP family transporter
MGRPINAWAAFLLGRVACTIRRLVEKGPWVDAMLAMLLGGVILVAIIWVYCVISVYGSGKVDPSSTEFKTSLSLACVGFVIFMVLFFGSSTNAGDSTPCRELSRQY